MAMRFLLADVRKRSGLSQYKLAKKIGMTAQAVQHLEYSAKQINLDTLNKLCNALECTPSDLIEYTPDSEVSQA